MKELGEEIKSQLRKIENFQDLENMLITLTNKESGFFL